MPHVPCYMCRYSLTHQGSVVFSQDMLVPTQLDWNQLPDLPYGKPKNVSQVESSRGGSMQRKGNIIRVLEQNAYISNMIRLYHVTDVAHLHIYFITH